MIRAVIFDMDGLMIDSEPLWSEAQRAILEACGVNMHNQGEINTTGLRIDMVVDIWHERQPWEGESKEEVCQRIINYVTEKVISTKPTMPGLHQLVEYLSSKGFKLAIASSSPMSLIKSMVVALELENKFDVLTSAGELSFAKPHPEVYLKAAAQLGVSPNECIALEDSFSGLLAAKSARMKVVVVPDATQYDQAHWVIADGKARSLTDSINVISNLL